jgi:hypothetical protein
MLFLGLNVNKFAFGFVLLNIKLFKYKLTFQLQVLRLNPMLFLNNFIASPLIKLLTKQKNYAHDYPSFTNNYNVV